MRRSFSFLVLLLFIASCGSKFSLQKRKYSKGFYWAKTAKSTTRSKVRSHENFNKEEKVVENGPTNYSVIKEPEGPKMTAISIPLVPAKPILVKEIKVPNSVPATIEKTNLLQLYGQTKKHIQKRSLAGILDAFMMAFIIVGIIIGSIAVYEGIKLIQLGLTAAAGIIFIPLGLLVALFGLIILLISLKSIV